MHRAQVRGIPLDSAAVGVGSHTAHVRLDATTTPIAPLGLAAAAALAATQPEPAAATPATP